MLLVFILIIGLSFFVYRQQIQINDLMISSQSSTKLTVPLEIANKENTVISFSECVDCDSEVQKMIDLSISNLEMDSFKEVAIVTSQKTNQTSYIPLGSISTSTSTDWYTIPDASAYIDLANDFSKDAYVTWEASMKVAHGNGQVMARLWDDTNKIAVNGSELTAINQENYLNQKSPQLYLWNGNNHYKVQVKTLSGYEVTISDAKVKVVY